MMILIHHLLILFCAAVWYGGFDQVSLAKEKGKESPSIFDARKAIKTPAERGKGSPDSAIKKAGRQSQPDSAPRSVLSQRSPATAWPPAGHPPAHHRMNRNKKVLPKAILKPSFDFRSHGMLEDPRRYDSRLHHQTSGLQDPQTSHMAYDHFQELDRNQDGRIDPVERAVGRLDMDRDLPEHHR
jgi:hypothetical protein